MQHFFICFYSVFLLNHLYLYFFVDYLNDFRNLTIDFCLCIVIPSGLIVLTNKKQAERYHPIDSNGKVN